MFASSASAMAPTVPNRGPIWRHVVARDAVGMGTACDQSGMFDLVCSLSNLTSACSAMYRLTQGWDEETFAYRPASFIHIYLAEQ